VNGEAVVLIADSEPVSERGQQMHAVARAGREEDGREADAAGIDVDRIFVDRAAAADRDQVADKDRLVHARLHLGASQADGADRLVDVIGRAGAGRVYVDFMDAATSLPRGDGLWPSPTF
jgi:hypothetical protein